MNKNFDFTLWLTLAILATACLLSYQSKPKVMAQEPTIEVVEVIDPLFELRVLFDALSFVESTNRPYVVGQKGDAGIIQISPVYVKEINRLLGYEKYKHSDAFCPELSWDMFTLYQQFKNEELCIKKAIMLHNPRAGKRYFDKVYNEYLRILATYDEQSN